MYVFQNTLLSIERKGDRVTNGSSHQDLGPGLSSAPDGQHGDHPLHLLGRVVMQQSYVCALIAMMVTLKYNSHCKYILSMSPMGILGYVPISTLEYH